ncbi:hypothetical protein NQ314_009479 [Rhamnusium bicolor]|uniref:PiggyBac transposable element-derived protein domain-containing protein n=1 Tax=Rhamnusium bicolor TaxID=1586634 RepID=A0AAV8Y1S1_9CUCU|nr:hypothetical protein NQ314_009479 [Rhamnusium bicolor]
MKKNIAAAISFIFNKFVKNCQRSFDLGRHGCVDEMMINFRRCYKFKKYMPNKPDKYGIKLLSLTDATTSYSNGYIYTAKDSDSTPLLEEEKKLQKPTQAVVRLCKLLQNNSHRIIIADN